MASVSKAAAWFAWTVGMEELDHVGKEKRPALQNHPTDWLLINSLLFAKAMIRRDSVDNKEGRGLQNQKQSQESQKLSLMSSRIYSRSDIPLRKSLLPHGCGSSCLLFRATTVLLCQSSCALAFPSGRQNCGVHPHPHLFHLFLCTQPDKGNQVSPKTSGYIDFIYRNAKLFLPVSIIPTFQRKLP